VKQPRKKQSVSREVLKPLKKRARENDKPKEEPSIGAKPDPSAELDQDQGGGYNRDRTFPQT
jgi:hypothetical protein